jgi:hypothetical protein
LAKPRVSFFPVPGLKPQPSPYAEYCKSSLDHVAGQLSLAIARRIIEEGGLKVTFSIMGLLGYGALLVLP